MRPGIPHPELSFAGVLAGLLGLMWLGSRAMRRDGRSVAAGRRAVLAALYAGVYLTFVGPAALTPACLSALGALVALELKNAFADGRRVRFGGPTLAALLLWAVGLPWILGRETAAALPATWLAAAGLGALALAPLLGGSRRGQYQTALVTVLATAALDAFCVLRLEPQGTALCLFAFFLINVADTSAYFCGKRFGRHRLAPAISPGKTIEGSLGSLAITLACASLFAWVLALPFTAAQTAVAALILNGLGQAGDLLASWLKRQLGLKDFGTLLRGHGGVLDRFDSCLLAVPAFAAWLKWIA